MKFFLKWFLVAILILAFVVLYRAFTFKDTVEYKTWQATIFKPSPQILAKALTYPTISHKAEMIDDSAFVGFHKYLAETFPLVDSLLIKEKINDYSLIYTWEGSNKNLKPLVLAAHMDVVPVEYASLKDWELAPFEGAIKDGYIYGRGTLDDKGSLIAILNAVELLLEEHYKPEQSIILCFGHDEEIGGTDGAAVMAKVLEERGVQAEMVIDEGGTLSKGLVPGVAQEVALIGTAEKGYVSLELSVEVEGGHSSMPEKETAIGVLNKAIYTLQQSPMPYRITEPLEGFINSLGPHMPFLQKMAFANVWLFKSMIVKEYEKSASGAALLQTTQVPTIFQAGIKDNVIPTRAKATINYRLLPGDSPQSILERAKKIVDNDKVSISYLEEMQEEASAISKTDCDAFIRLGSAIKAIYPEALISPYLVLGATDGRYYYNITDKVYRFSPFPLEADDLKRIHGLNERVSIEDYNRSVNFYATLIKNKVMP